MNRRTFLCGLTLGTLSAPLAGGAQQTAKVAKIGYLSPGSATAAAQLFDAFKQGLREHGYIEGQNIVIETRFAEGRMEQLPVLAAELVNLDVDVFVVGVNRVAVAVLQANTKIPIVMAVAEDPVGVGLVKSLARPGGNITGLTIVTGPEFGGKVLELLRDALPKRARIAILFNATSAMNAHWLKAIEEAAPKLRVRLVPTGVRSAEDFEEAFALMKRGGATGFFVLGEPLFFSNIRRLNDLAVQSGLAAMWPFREGVDTGGLISYGASLPDLFRRAATYVDKILKGAKAADLPMEQPTRFELVINLKTAKALGLTIPQSLLLRADQVIE
jgi:putative ABC transport system substrate-binding protein